MPEPNDDAFWMQRALQLARDGQGYVEPNPMVGCVLVRDGQLIGRGFHARFGGPHAEIAALEDCQENPAGSTAYLNLEPCSHHGKTPPCVDALIQASVARVVVADEDPFPQVAGSGIEQLKAAGIAVHVGTLREPARRLNAPYLKRVATGRPWVIAKWAMTLDGKIATHRGDSRWISSERSRQIVHELRARMDGILVGRGTAQADDPLLTARPAGPRTATRIVLDSILQCDASLQIVKTAREVPALFATGPARDQQRADELAAAGCEVIVLDSDDPQRRLELLLEELGSRGMTNLLVEGGSGVLGGFFDAGQIDEVHVFVSPHLVGGRGAVTPIGGVGVDRVADALNPEWTTRSIVDGDFYLTGRVHNP